MSYFYIILTKFKYLDLKLINKGLVIMFKYIVFFEWHYPIDVQELYVINIGILSNYPWPRN